MTQNQRTNLKRRSLAMTNDQNVNTAIVTPAGFVATRKEWAALNDLWNEEAAIFDPKKYSGVPDTVFFILLMKLVSLAKYKGADNNDMMEWLLKEALECGPKGRVSRLVSDWFSQLQNRVWPQNRDEGRLVRLLYQAYSLMKCGDEDTIENELHDLYQQHALTEEELLAELAAIGIKAKSITRPEDPPHADEE
jgi:hypothetical protein